MDIKITFHNQSSDTGNAQVVIFQKNVALPDADPVAWHVIQHCDPGESHALTFPAALTVRASDGFGNLSAHLPARPGHAFAVSQAEGGDTLRSAGVGDSVHAVQVSNGLLAASIDAHIYRDGRLLATHLAIPPDGKIAFQFKPTIWVGVASQVEQGQVMPKASTEAMTTEFSLEGIASADIVMTGGGPGPKAQPFAFALANVVRA